MKIQEALLQEHTKTNRQKIVNYVGADKKRFAELMELMLCAEYRLAQRAAWSVSYCVQRHKSLIDPWLEKMIQKLQEENIPDAVRRNSLRILQDMDIPERYAGSVYACCFRFIHTAKEAIAVRAYSLSIAAAIARTFPELKTELLHSAESLLHCGIPALEARSRAVCKQLTKPEKK